jgi:NAD(P)-dependent dehydrogenase (short-subunit alcohol dehydrogenase family)
VATPTTRALELPGPDGSDGGAVPVQVTSAAGKRPVVVLSGGPGARAAFVQRLARAGFATVACDPRSPAELAVVLAALERGALGVGGTAAAGYRLVECKADGSTTVSRVQDRVRVAGPVLRAGRPDEVLETVSQWLLRTLP